MMKESHNVQTNDLIHLFSTTFKSLADDAECIREISTLAELMGVVPTSSSIVDGEEDYAQQLRQLDQIISNMEEKVRALREIINEENRALVKFETTLKGEADTEARLIDEMMSLVFQGKDVQGNNNNNNNNHTFQRHRTRRDNDDINATNNTKFRVLNSRPVCMINNSGTNDTSPVRRFISSEKTHRQQRHNISRDSQRETVSDIDEEDIDEKDELSSYHSYDSYSSTGQHRRPRNIKFVPVTESEVEEHYRNIPFGSRISRLDLNDALEEIEQVLAKKIAVEYPIKKTPVHHQHDLSSNSLQRRFDYLRQRQRGTVVDNMETEAHVGYWWVSEQELRENCPFFGHGESTARAILSLLCSLKRLKRVPAKNKDITYLWL